MKKSNLLLLGLLGLLILVFFLTDYLKKNDSDTHFDVDVVNIDSVNVKRVEITPPSTASGKQLISVVKEGKDWKVFEGDKNDITSKSSIKELLSTLENLKIQRLVSKNKEKWEKFKVNDSLATKVNVQQSSGKDIAFFLGSFATAAGSATHVRFDGNDNVYQVKGFLSTVFDKEYNAWRNNLISKFKKEDLKSLNFEYLGTEEESFNIMKQDTVWDISGTTANESKVSEYINRIISKSLTEFADDFSPIGPQSTKLTISGDKFNEYSIMGYKQDGKNYINSTLVPETYFMADSTQFADIFAKKDFFN